MSAKPTGDQYRISYGEHEAVVTEVGAGLRTYTIGGVDVVHGFDEDEECHSGRGQHLMPWPNRIRDGVYTFGGVRQQLALSEPDKDNAIHGLVRWSPFVVSERTPSRIEQRLRLHPQTGWSGILDLKVAHSLDDNGLTVEVTATNVGATPAPFGYAAHPYLTVGESRVDDVDLTLPAATYLEVDERLLPLRLTAVDGLPTDGRHGGSLGDRRLDTAFTDLARDTDGRWRVTLRLGERETALWADSSCPWLQVFTGDTLHGELRRASGIAVEPMTCGPDAFNDGPTHDGMVTLEPQKSIAVLWGIAAKV